MRPHHWIHGSSWPDADESSLYAMDRSYRLPGFVDDVGALYLATVGRCPSSLLAGCRRRNSCLSSEVDIQVVSFCYLWCSNARIATQWYPLPTPSRRFPLTAKIVSLALHPCLGGFVVDSAHRSPLVLVLRPVLAEPVVPKVGCSKALVVRIHRREHSHYLHC